MRLIGIILLGLVGLPSASAFQPLEVSVLSCYDADTCRVNLPRSAFAEPWAYEIFGHNIPIRIEGIDTPEIKGRCPQEKTLAKQARNYVRALLAQASSVTLLLHEDPRKVRGKYFRLIGRLVVDGRDLSDLLIQQGLAVPYDGGKKTKNWCIDIAPP